QTETEATGAPQKHHYTLNQQVGSITRTPKLWLQRLINPRMPIGGGVVPQQMPFTTSTRG
ncbi:hypothetical protein SBU94_19130, partial [Klebsiella pneumoniae]|uniref:hypothetical protein n=1 Tax=Klebsiella pneumoniae TaxID=573 RepID=UPI00298D515D